MKTNSIASKFRDLYQKVSIVRQTNKVHLLQMRLSLSELKVIIMDEISMLVNTALLQINHLFQMTELTEIMRRKNDQPFTELLNRFRTASQTDEDIQSIQSRSMNPLDNNYPLDVLHTWAENIPITNKTMQNYNNLRDPCFS